MKRLICLLTLTFFATAAFAQDEGETTPTPPQTKPAPPDTKKQDEAKRDPKAVEILKKVDETTKKIQAVRYHA